MSRKMAITALSLVLWAECNSITYADPIEETTQPSNFGDFFKNDNWPFQGNSPFRGNSPLFSHDYGNNFPYDKSYGGDNFGDNLPNGGNLAFGRNLPYSGHEDQVPYDKKLSFGGNNFGENLPNGVNFAFGVNSPHFEDNLPHGVNFAFGVNSPHFEDNLPNDGNFAFGGNPPYRGDEGKVPNFRGKPYFDSSFTPNNMRNTGDSNLPMMDNIFKMVEKGFDLMSKTNEYQSTYQQPYRRSNEAQALKGGTITHKPLYGLTVGLTMTLMCLVHRYIQNAIRH